MIESDQKRIIATWADLFKLCLLLFNSFLASGNFCHPLITFANSLDPDQARQNVGPDLEPDCWTDGIPERFFCKIS